MRSSMQRSVYTWLNVRNGVTLRTVVGCDWRFDNQCGNHLQSLISLSLTLKIIRTKQIVKTSVTTNNNPSQDYTSPDDQPPTNTDSPGSQLTTVLLRTTPTWTINQLQTLTHLGYNQQQSFSGLHQPGRSTNNKHWLTWVTTNNSPSQDYTNPDDQPTNHKHWLTWVTTNNSPSQDYTNPNDQPTTDIDSPGFKPFTHCFMQRSASAFVILKISGIFQKIYIWHISYDLVTCVNCELFCLK